MPPVLSQPKISLIVPVYNTAKYLPRCLESISKQSHTNFECILVNDGSTDESISICEEFCRNDKRFILINQINSGVSAARNTGIQAASGEYIIFADSDDEVTNDYLSDLANESYEFDIVISGVQFFNSSTGTKRERFFSPASILNFETNSILNIIKQKAHDLVFAKRFKRSIIQQNCIKFDADINLGEDTLFTCRYITVSRSCKLIQNTNYIYYTGDHQSLSTFTAEAFKKLVNLHNTLSTLFKPLFPDILESEYWITAKYKTYYLAIFDTINSSQLSPCKKLRILQFIIKTSEFNNFLQWMGNRGSEKIIHTIFKSKSAFIIYIAFSALKLYKTIYSKLKK